MFVFVSLLMLAIMVVYFGRLGDGFRRYYRITATFSNASGLIKGADVLMAGAKVGIVEERPTLLAQMNGVEVPLQIYEDVKIPEGSGFIVGRSGLLGDRYVDILVPEGQWKNTPIPAGSRVDGTRGGGIDDLTLQAQAIVNKANATMDDARKRMEKINETILSDETLVKIKETITNINTTSQNISTASKRIDAVITDAQSAVKAGQKTMVTAQEAAQELKTTITDVRGIVQRTKNGEGVIGALLTDRTMAQNLRSLILNLRQHGILWYKDSAKSETGR